MNYRGSYRKLLGNARAAIIAAIEVYNKPGFEYRDECFTILLLNAWELMLKALLSKNAQSIFYPKKRKEPYRTLSWHDALGRAEHLFPKELPVLPVKRNLELLGTYRDNAVHFYNAPGFSVLVYALAQTSVTNFRDLLLHCFGWRLEDEITWHLLPLGIKPPVDALAYIAGKKDEVRGNAAVRQYLSELATSVREVEEAGDDTGRLLTVFSVKLESIKKIEKADLVIGVQKPAESTGPLAIVRPQDPNISHPLRQKEIVAAIDTLHGVPFTPHTFQAIAWKHDLKSNAQFCWQAKEGVLTKYSNDVVALIKRLTAADIGAALKDYRAHLLAKRKEKRNGKAAA